MKKGMTMLFIAYSEITIILLATSLILGTQCQQQYQQNCPYEWTLCGNICVFVSTEKALWGMASEACKSFKNDSHLLILNTREKDENIRRCLLQSSSFDAEKFWIDGIFNDKQKRWISGETALPLQYQGFSRRHTQDDSEWRCIALNKKIYYRWSSVSCFSNEAFICEIQ